MGIRIRPAAQLADKYASNSAANVKSYTEGVANPRRDWQQATAAAKDTYEAAMMESLSEGRYEKGVTAEAGQKQKTNAAKLGQTRYPEGTKNAKDAWAKNSQPIFDALAGVGDMPRGVKGSEQNFQRQRAYAMAAHDASKKS